MSAFPWWWQVFVHLMNAAGMNDVLDAICTAFGWDH